MSQADSLHGSLCHWKAGDFAESERVARGLLAGRPDQPVVLTMLALALHGQGRNEDALEAIRRAMRIATLAPELYHNAGVILAALGRLDEALPCFHQAAVLAPRLLPGHGPARWRDDGRGGLELDPGFTVDAVHAAAARPIPPNLAPPQPLRGT